MTSDLPPASPAQPAASVTRGFLFADLRGYTSYVEQQGDRAAADLLDRYRALVREVIGRFQGAEIRTEGDSFYVVFPSASAAVRAGMSIVEQARSAEPPIRVGVGIHAGETVDTAEGAVGSAVNIAARICSVAPADEVLVSDTVRSLTRTVIEVGFVPFGARRLKGISEPIQLYRATLPSVVTPASSGGSVRTGVRRFWPAASIAVAIAAAVVVWIGVSLRSAASPTPSPSPSIAAVSSGTTLPSPTGALGQLLSRVPEDVRPDCVPTGPLSPGASESQAAVRCDLSGAAADTVWYEIFDGIAEAEGALQAVATRQALPVGTCGPGSGQATGDWRFGSGSIGGRQLCYSSGGDTWTVWSYAETPILARAVRHDTGHWDDLYAWWDEVGPFLQ